jgi:hypothetical protein
LRFALGHVPSAAPSLRLEGAREQQSGGRNAADVTGVVAA